MARVLIVDDEPLARRRIRMMLDEFEKVDIVGECSNGFQAVESIMKFGPEIVFLDIQMPEMDGFEVLQAVGTEKMPVVIFVTAYDQYAVKAFEVNAVDYLLKPFDKERFKTSFQRALLEIAKKHKTGPDKNIDALLHEINQHRGPVNKILVKDLGRISIINIEQIDWIESAGNYVKIHVGKQTYLHRETMRNIQKRLSLFNFVRIHRRTIVNTERILQLLSCKHGDYIIVLRDGTKLTLSRRYRQNLDSVLRPQ